MNLDNQLARLESAQIVHRTDDPDPAYLFKHTLTQETAYQSLLQKRRREIHHRVAQAYETIYADRLDENAALLEQHYAEAGDDAKALTYASLAGDAAARVYANAEAISHYSLALELAKRGARTDGRPSLRDLYLKRGRALEVASRYAEALANYQDMEGAAQERGDRSLELAALMATTTVRSITTPVFDPKKGQALSDRALALARGLGDRQAQAKILWNLMLLKYFTNQPEASVEYGERSLALARQLNLREQLAFTLNDLSRSYVSTGRLESAFAAQSEATALWRELGNLPLLADSLTNSASLHLYRGDLDRALASVEEALRIARSIGNVWGQVYAEQILSYVCYERGEIGAALAALQDSIQLAEQIGALFAIPFGYAMLSWAYARLGVVARAIELANQAVSKAEQMLPAHLPLCRAMLAYAYLRKGDLTQAQVIVEKSYDGLNPKDFDSPQPYYVMMTDAEVALADREYARALQVLDRLIGTLRRIGIRTLVSEVLYLKSRVLVASGQRDQARAILLQARDSAESVGERLSLIPILSSLAEMEAECGDTGEAQILHAEAEQIVQSIAANLPQDLRALFLNSPDVIRAIGSS